MAYRDVEVRYDRDDVGRIIRAGVSWGETRPSIEQFAISGALGSVFLLIVGVFYSPTLLMGLVGLAACIYVLFWLPPEVRALYFTNDGRMLTPFGIFYASQLQQISGHHDHIVSIEARMQRDQPARNGERWEAMFEVLLISDGGDLIHLSRNCHESDALRVAAQLTRALVAIRGERGGSHNQAWVEYS